ncbi:MAG: hypothetical protein R2762_14050 [Bryobacteraceae bacterium]
MNDTVKVRERMRAIQELDEFVAGLTPLPDGAGVSLLREERDNPQQQKIASGR